MPTEKKGEISLEQSISGSSTGEEQYFLQLKNMICTSCSPHEVELEFNTETNNGEKTSDTIKLSDWENLFVFLVEEDIEEETNNWSVKLDNIDEFCFTKRWNIQNKKWELKLLSGGITGAIEIEYEIQTIDEQTPDVIN